MNWKNLKDCLCPKCETPLELDYDQDIYFCTSATCTFSVSRQRFNEMQLDMETGHRNFKGRGFDDDSGWNRFD